MSNDVRLPNERKEAYIMEDNKENKINILNEYESSKAFINLLQEEYNEALMNVQDDIYEDNIMASDRSSINIIDRKKKLEQTSYCIDFLMNSLNKKFDSEIGLNLLEAQERERQRIAADLHDSTVQNLTSLFHKAELCFKLIDMDSVRAKLELSSMSNTIKVIIDEMRDVIFNLKPMSLCDLGLSLTIERYIDQLRKEHDIHIKYFHNDEIMNVVPVINTTLFRIIKEACSNVIKHATASLLEINIEYCLDSIRVSIIDDGEGFDIEEYKTNNKIQLSNFGISIMQERAALLSGTLKIESTKGKGTKVTIAVPATTYKGDTNE